MTRTTRKLKVGYILKMFPRFSETFIMNEMIEMERQGVDLEIFSILPPMDGKFHPMLSRLRAPVHYLPPHRYSEYWRILRSSRGFLRNHKKGYSRALWHAAECSKDSALKYFILAGYIVDMSRARGFDRFHSHFASSPTHIAMYASMMSGIPFSFTSHAKDIYLHDLDKKLLRDMIKFSSFSVTVSDANKDYLNAIVGNRFKEKIFRIYNGLDLGYFNDQNRERIPNLILSVGRLVEKKGFHVLIKAVKILKERGKKYKCEIIGEGNERASLESRISRYNLGRSVKLLGALSQNDVIRKMQKASIFALPSVIAEDGNRDSLPTVLLEAMAIGLPIISTDLVGIPEILDHGSCGMIIKSNDPDGMADAIEAVNSPPARAKRFIQAGKRKVKRDFNIKTNVRELQNCMRINSHGS